MAGRIFDDSLYDSITKIVKEDTFENIDFPELSSDTLIARLKELDSKTPFHISYNPALETLIKNYLKLRKAPYERLMKLSQYYFPLFEEIFDREGIPLEIKYLAIVESALKPSAKSTVGATGLWQFMFSTGKYFDLEVSSYVDERCDPVRSTTAAAKYLKSLHKSFDDWDLSYRLQFRNNDQEMLQKQFGVLVVIKTIGTFGLFFQVKQQDIYQLFLATMYIFEYASQHGFDVPRHKKCAIIKQTLYKLKT